MKEAYKPRVTGKRFAYTFFYTWFSPFLWMHWKRKQFVGLENVPKNKPIFLSPNHANAFVEPVALIHITRSRQLTFLLRAAAFGNKIVDKLFQHLNMLPIYRQLDGNDQLDKNNAIYANCVWLLERNRVILAFPEGSHSMVKQLRPFKKGPIRFGFGAEEKNDFKLDVHFVPVGISYNKPYDFGGDMLINIGKPIRVADYVDLYKQSSARGINALKKDLEQAISALMVDIRNNDYRNEIDTLRTIGINSYREQNNRKTSLHDEFLFGKKIIGKAENELFQQPEKALVLKHDLNEYTSALQKHGIQDEQLDASYKPVNKAWYGLLLICLFPLFVPGILINYLPFYMPSRIARKVVRDPAFKSSVIWAAALFIFSILYVLIFVLTGLISGNWLLALGVFLGCILLAFFTLFYIRMCRRLRADLLREKFLKTTTGKYLTTLRTKIVSYIQDVF